MKNALFRMRAGTVTVFLAAALGIVATAAPAASAAPTASAASAVNCDPVLLTAAGSDQQFSSAELDAVTAAAKAAARADGFKLDVVPVAYPAVPFTRYVRPNLSVNWDGLAKSEATGVAAMNAAIATVRACPGRPVLLAGYSQGADVVSQVVNAMTPASRSTVSVALLGNPSFLPNLSQDYGNYNKKRRGIRQSFGTASYPITAPDVAVRTVDACLLDDAICNYNTANFATLLNGRSAHFRYVTSGYAAYVGAKVWKLRAGDVASSPIKISPPTGPTGTVITATSSSPCPAGTTRARLDAVGVDTVASTEVGANGVWVIKAQTFGPDTTDPRSGLQASAAINWDIRVVCENPDGVVKQYKDARFVGSIGIPIRLKVSATNDPGTLTVTATPISGCPVPSDGVRVFAGTTNISTFETSPTQTRSVRTGKSGQWPSIPFNLKRFAVGTRINVGAQCIRGLGTAGEATTFYYSSAEALLP